MAKKRSMNLNSIPFEDRVRIKAERRRVVKKHHKNGRSLNEIAVIIGMSRKSVCRIVNDLRKHRELPPMTEEVYTQRVSRHHRAIAALKAGNLKKYAKLYNSKIKNGTRPSKVSIGREIGIGETCSYNYYKDAVREGLIEPIPTTETYPCEADPETVLVPVKAAVSTESNNGVV